MSHPTPTKKRTRDPLTGFSLDHVLPTEESGRALKAPFSVAIFDIVGLQKINREFGRAVGDTIIASLAKSMRSAFPHGSLFYRGYEAELIAITKGKDEEQARVYAEKVKVQGVTILYGLGNAIEHDPDHNPGAALSQASHDLRLKKLTDEESLRSQVLTSLIHALESTDPDTEEHVQRTRKTGLALGQKIGISEYEKNTLNLLCLLHDIGKIAIPLEILNKPGKLNDEEWAVLRSHPAKGADMVRAVGELAFLAPMVLSHHERWDGKGYPQGLKGDEIPILARIISIVDAYDAMVNDRGYRVALSIDEAKQELERNAGTQFDPNLVKAFLELLETQPDLAYGKKTGGSVPELETFKRTEVKKGHTSPVPFCNYLLDQSDIIIKADKEFYRMMGYTPEETIGKISQFDLVPEEDKDDYIAHVGNQFAEHEDIAYLQHRIKTKNGKIIHVICCGQRFFDSAAKAYRSKILTFEVDSLIKS